MEHQILPDCNSGLSRGVWGLLYKTFDDFREITITDIDVFVQKTGSLILLDLQRLQTLLNPEKDWKTNLVSLLPVIKLCDKYVLQSEQTFDFSWCSSSKVFADALHFACSSSDINVHLALLLTTSAIEKTFRDVCYDIKPIKDDELILLLGLCFTNKRSLYSFVAERSFRKRATIRFGRNSDLLS
eukprot:m.189746 g.189746  ORF g.189746 m.189746 type:complete len:185 (+) comp39421_c0_seq12:206-760(+)